MPFLNELKWKPRWASRLGCLGGCLDYLKLGIGEAWLYGGSGQAFVINIHEQVCPSGPTAWRTEPVDALAGKLGFEIDLISGHKGEVDFEAKRRLVWDKTRAAIDAGRPCFGWEMKIPEYYVIRGYDEVGYHFQGPLCETGGGPLPWEKLGDSEIGVIEMASLRGSQPAADLDIIKGALEFALEMAAEPQRWTFSRYQMGPAAFELWRSALTEGSALGMGMAYNAAVWAECRQQAACFLKEAGARLNGELTPKFKAAARDYGKVASSLDALARVFPFLDTSDKEREDNVKDPKRRRMGAEYLEAAREAEIAGIGRLGSIVELL